MTSGASRRHLARVRLTGTAFLALMSMDMTTAAAKTTVAPPPTRVEDVVETLHGVVVHDPYRWLENGEQPEVQAWTAGQNAATRAALDSVPGRQRLERRLWQLHEIGSLGTPTVRDRGSARPRRYFYTRRDGKQNQPVLYVRDGLQGEDRVVVDVNALATDGTAALDWWYPSEDGSMVAYGVSRDGSEESVLRVHDVDGSRELAEHIERTRACSLAWLPDGRGFFYTRYPSPGEVPAGEASYHRAVYFHTLGASPAQDVRVFGDGRDLRDWPAVTVSPGGRWLVVEVEQGWAKSEVWMADLAAGGVTGPAAPPTAGPRADAPKRLSFVPVATGEAALFVVSDLLDDVLYLRTNAGASRYRLYAVDPRSPARAGWSEVLPEGGDILEDAVIVGGKLAATYLENASSRVRLFERDGRFVREIPLPGLGTVTGLRGRATLDDLFVGFTSFLTPTHILHFDLGSMESVVWRQLPNPIDADRFQVRQDWFTSRDGTRCPMFVIHRKGLRMNARNPTLLYGYGGFNLNSTPSFAAYAAPFLEAGGVYAVATLRGGGEYGESWHQAGMLGRKQNVFDDFIAAAEHLVKTRVTSPERLAISGRSNGGLLVGAVLTQRPDLFRAVLCGVPLLDMVRYHQFRIARLWTPEYGSSEDAEQSRWLLAYSPYHRVQDGVRYPAVLLFTAESDTRVDPLHARKMAARLQAASSSGRPVLLRMEGKAGHGAGKPLSKIIAQYTDEWTFVFSQLGVRIPQPR